MILHVVDASNPEYSRQMEVVYETLKELGVVDKPVLTAFNKIDQIDPGKSEALKDLRSDETVRISARHGVGMEELLNAVEELLNQGFVTIERLVSYSDAGFIQKVRQYGKLEIEEYREDGIFIRASVPPFIG